MGRTFFHRLSGKGLAPFSHVVRRGNRRLRGQAQILESTLVRVVIAVSILATIGVFTMQMGTTKTQQMKVELVFLSDLIQRVFINSGNYSALAGSNPQQFLISSSSMPHKYVSGGNLINPFGTQITVRVFFNDSTMYWLSATVPASYCTDMATIDLGPRQVYISVNGTSNLNVATGANSGPMTMPQAISACARASSTVVASWYLR